MPSRAREGSTPLGATAAASIFAAEQLKFAALREEGEGGCGLRSTPVKRRYSHPPKSLTRSFSIRNGGDERRRRDATGGTRHAPQETEARTARGAARPSPAPSRR